MPVYEFPYDSNIRYLPLVYFLSEDLIVKYPLLRTLPRGLGEISKSDGHIFAIQSDVFLNKIMDAAAALAFAFPHFGFGGWKEHHTGYFPVWRLSYALPLWTKLLEEETGWSLQRIFQIPSFQSIPFFDCSMIFRFRNGSEITV